MLTLCTQDVFPHIFSKHFLVHHLLLLSCSFWHFVIYFYIFKLLFILVCNPRKSIPRSHCKSSKVLSESQCVSFLHGKVVALEENLGDVVSATRGAFLTNHTEGHSPVRLVLHGAEARFAILLHGDRHLVIFVLPLNCRICSCVCAAWKAAKPGSWQTWCRTWGEQERKKQGGRREQININTPKEANTNRHRRENVFGQLRKAKRSFQGWGWTLIIEEISRQEEGGEEHHNKHKHRDVLV